MVRPEERRASRARARGWRRSGWTSLGGVSPLPVGVGAPGSRSQARGEILVSRAGCQKPKRWRGRRDGEQARGPQHEVKPAASTEEQSGSRAAHVTVKATSGALVPKRALDPGGVWGVARVQRDVRNRRGPSGRPYVTARGAYKPKAKSQSGQRKSEGSVVPMTLVQQNAGRGKGPHFGYVEGGSTGEGMTGQQIRSNYPRRQPTRVQARQCRRRLGTRAKPTPRGRAGFGKPGCSDAHSVESFVVRQGCGAMPGSESPSVSRVRENRTHGLNGGPTGTSHSRKER